MVKVRSVLILLPPSESKVAPARRGKPVAPEELCFPHLLTDARKAVLTALVEQPVGA